MTKRLRSPRVLFPFLLALAMGGATFLPNALGILASEVLDGLDISRAQLGVVIAVIAVTGALSSPTIGRFTDRLGGRRAFVIVYATAGLSLIGVGLAPSYWFLFVPGVVAAVSQAGSNPATNKLIAVQLEPGSRGVTTGIKQSGVQAAVVVGGLTLPALAEAAGWRWAFVVPGLLPLLVIPAIYFSVPPDPPTSVATRSRVPVSTTIRRLAVYGFLMGFAGASTFFFALFVEEALDETARIGGVVFAVMGLFAFIGRIGWARGAENSGRYVAILVGLALLTMVAASLMWISDGVGVWLAFVGSALTGLSVSSWNSVGMLTVMVDAGEAATGQASGVVLLGFLGGLGLAPPIFGWTIDQTGSYHLVWMLTIIAGALAAASLARVSVRHSAGVDARRSSP